LEERLLVSDMGSWRDEWALSLAAGTRKPNTQRAYLRGPDVFNAWIERNGLDLTADQVTRKHVEAWMRAMIEAKFCEGTRRLRVMAVRLWFAYILVELGLPADRNPTNGLSLPAPDEAPVPVLSDEQMVALLATCDRRTYLGARDEALIRVMADAGPRVGEVAAMNVDDVDLRRQRARVTGKTGTRDLFLSNRTCLALTRWQRFRAAHRVAKRSEALWLSRNSTRADYRLSEVAIREMVGARGERAGLGHVWPHMLRHLWAHDIKAANISTENLEVLGGWSPGSKEAARYGRSMAQQRALDAAQQLSRGDRF
jgi:integrase/recombinase XerC